MSETPAAGTDVVFSEAFNDSEFKLLELNPEVVSTINVFTNRTLPSQQFPFPELRRGSWGGGQYWRVAPPHRPRPTAAFLICASIYRIGCSKAIPEVWSSTFSSIECQAIHSAPHNNFGAPHN